jgi:4-hydroxybenzoate polyprenyltransferase
MLKRLHLYSRFVKIEHTVFSVPLLLSGALLAAGRLPGWRLCLWILAAGTGARVVAFAVNRIADRHIDARNPRTAERELPRGAMNVAEGWAVGAAGLALYLFAAWTIAPICFYLSPLPLIVFALYPFLKRFSPLCHFGVGLADAFAPLGGWLAVTHSLHAMGPGVLLALFTFFWVSGFDIIYATLDETFDRAQGLHSLPARLGSAKALRISAVLHAAAFLSLTALYFLNLRSPAALVTLLGIGALLYLEHASAEDVDLAFFKINAVLSFGVLAFVAVGVVGGL